MSSDNIAIRISHVSKQYRIGGPQEPYHTFRDAVINTLKSPLSAFSKESMDDKFWALKDITLDIERGEVIGIIGRNGAGKSTLLKILSRITSPTEGRIELHGRVGSLLEVGTGFHPELTGRENIYLSGSILGMKRKEIDAKLDDIIKFSEIEQFIDTPVKRYSSGMYVRLGFAVAAHLEPEILVVDEVLAVGDAAFQKKCLGKMENVAKEGRTVLFVSHQMGSVAQLCSSAVLLDHGQISHKGPVSEVIAGYMDQLSQGSMSFKSTISDNKEIAIVKAIALDASANPMAIFTHRQPITIEITCRFKRWVRGAEVRIMVRDSRRNIFTSDSEIIVDSDHISEIVVATVTIPGNLLRPERYFFSLMLYIPNQVIFEWIRDAFSISVIDGGSKYAASEGFDYGCVFVDCTWSIKSQANG